MNFNHPILLCFKMGNKNIKSNIDPDLIQLINDNKNLKHVLRNPHYNLLERFILSWDDYPIPKYNLLQRLILYSDNFLIKKYLVNNIYKYKKEINFQNGRRQTSLIIACRNSNTYCDNEIVKLLLENGADPNLKDIDGCTALMKACIYFNNYSNIETVKLLLENGADINLKDYNGYTALMMACKYSNTRSDPKIIKLLLENGADINLKDNNDQTALMLSCRYVNTYSNPEIIKLLLNQNNIDVNIINNDTKYNALMLLCQYNSNQYEIATLLKSKTNLNHKNYRNKKIEDICLNEYKYIFIRNWVTVFNNHDTIISECIICANENAKCIICNHGHATCYVCLDKLNFKCEGCQLVL